MKLPQDQVDQYNRDGVISLGQVFADDEVDLLRAELAADLEVAGPHRVTEDDGKRVRAIYASHERCPAFRQLVCSDRLLEPAMQLLDADVYVYQFKINAKRAFGGDAWAWHQDYIVWRAADNMREPRALNVAVFLDEVTDFNGPVVFFRGSHRVDAIVDRRDGARSVQHIDPADFAIPEDRLRHLAQTHEMYGPTGPAGTVVLFHPEIVHGSATNISPFSRDLLIVTYNATSNVPRPVGEPRAAYLVGRDTTPLVVAGESLVAARD